MSEVLIKSKERVNVFGEVFSPSWVIEEMLNALPEEDFTNPEMVFMEPTFGTGNFVIAIIQRRIEKGITLIDALNTIVGMELQQDNVIECHNRIIAFCKEELLKEFSISSPEYKLSLAKCIMIIRNNLMQGDSLEYMRAKKICDHKFCYQPIYKSDTKVLSKKTLDTRLKKIVKSICV